MNNGISLRRKLISWLLSPMLVILGISAAGSYYVAYKFAYKAYDRSLADTARDLARQTTINKGQVMLDLPDPARRMLLTDEFDKIYFKVTGPDGVLVDGEPDLPAPDIISTNSVPIMHDGSLHGQRLRIASRYYIPSDSQTGRPVLVQVAETLNKRQTLEREILTALVLPQLALIGVALLALWTGVSKGLRPMRRLHDEIVARSYHDLSPIEENHAPIEVKPIIHAVNELMGRLEKALASQQRFIADAAHQLRTPIAEMKTRVDLALGQTDVESMYHSLSTLNVSLRKIVRLIKQMLNLAQVGPDASSAINLTPVNLTEVVKKISMEWVPRALERGLDLGFEGPEENMVIQGDVLRIAMLLDNLIDNAIRYSPQGSSITTRLENLDKIILSVEDNGPGIPEEERNRVFQRFYRISGSDSEGCGLGLSIAKEIADLHGAAVLIGEPKTHQGTLIQIIFPTQGK